MKIFFILNNSKKSYLIFLKVINKFFILFEIMINNIFNNSFLMRVYLV